MRKPKLYRIKECPKVTDSEWRVMIRNWPGLGTTVLHYCHHPVPQRGRRPKRKHHPQARISSSRASRCCLAHPPILQMEKLRFRGKCPVIEALGLDFRLPAQKPLPKYRLLWPHGDTSL